MAFDGTHKQGQSLSHRSRGQPLADQRDDFAFTVAQRHPLGCFTERRGAQAAALLCQRSCSSSADVRRSTKSIFPICRCAVGGSVGGGNKIAHALICLGYRGKFGTVISVRGGGKPCCEADA